MSNIKTKESKCIGEKSFHDYLNGSIAKNILKGYCVFCNKEIDDLDSKVTYDNEDYHEYCLEEKLLEEDF